MNDLINITNRDGQAVVSTLEVAERFGKEHKDVLRTIRNLAAENCAAKSMFYETTFENRGKDYPMYLMNRDGFSLLAMGFTGKEALEWKIKYIEAFNKMEEQIRKTGSYSIQEPETPAQLRAKAMMINAKTRLFNAAMKAVDRFQMSPVALEALGIPMIEEFTGVKTGYRPRIETTYSATELGAEFGVSANRIGRIAKDNGLKTDEYGITVLDKSRSSDKLVPCFRYNSKGRERLAELLKGGERNG